MPVNVTLQHHDQTFALTLTPQPDGTAAVTINGQPYTVRAERTAGGGWWLEIDGQRWQVYTAAQGDARYVHADGGTFVLTLPEMRTTSRRRSAGRADGLAPLTAQMPGKVTAVLVAVGDAVERGQALVLLEAMKMEMRVAAPEAGIVARMLVAPGQIVERGQPLAELRTTEEA